MEMNGNNGDESGFYPEKLSKNDGLDFALLADQLRACEILTYLFGLDLRAGDTIKSHYGASMHFTQLRSRYIAHSSVE